MYQITRQMRRVIRRVLNTAANTPGFFDLNERERLDFLISQSFVLGQLSAARASHRGQRRESQEDVDRKEAS